MTFENLVEKFIENPRSMNKSNKKLGERYGLETEQVRQAKILAKERRSTLYVHVEGQPIPKPSDYVTTYATSETIPTRVTSFTEDKVKGTAELSALVNEEIKTLEDLIRVCKIDTDIWEVSRYTQNFWGNSNNPSWQVKAYLTPKRESESAVIKKLLENYKSDYVPIEKRQVIRNPNFKEQSMLLISIADFHLDKRTLDNKTIDEKRQLYQQVLENLVFRAHLSHNIVEICYLISNDFFHTDTIFETTTRGTQQQSSISWDQGYEIGFDIQVRAISFMRQFCDKLKIIHVPSNHSKTKEFYMVHALNVYFREDRDIVFDRTSEPTKCTTFGDTFIGMHHGDVKSYDQLPGYFATKFRDQWGKCKYSEIALADKHHRKEWKHSMTGDEVHGTRMFIAPSLTSADEWHKNSLFDLAIKASIARIYNESKGYYGELEERI